MQVKCWKVRDISLKVSMVNTVRGFAFKMLFLLAFNVLKCLLVLRIPKWYIQALFLSVVQYSLRFVVLSNLHQSLVLNHPFALLSPIN